MPKSIVKYSAIGPQAYVWSAVKGDGSVIAGEVVKDSITLWRAVITHDNGEPFTIPEGGVLTGYASGRKAAVDRALDSYALGADGRFLRTMTNS
jgi:hypothetical protein